MILSDYQGIKLTLIKVKIFKLSPIFRSKIKHFGDRKYNFKEKINKNKKIFETKVKLKYRNFGEP